MTGNELKKLLTKYYEIRRVPQFSTLECPTSIGRHEFGRYTKEEIVQLKSLLTVKTMDQNSLFKQIAENIRQNKIDQGEVNIYIFSSLTMELFDVDVEIVKTTSNWPNIGRVFRVHKIKSNFVKFELTGSFGKKHNFLLPIVALNKKVHFYKNYISVPLEFRFQSPDISKVYVKHAFKNEEYGWNSVKKVDSLPTMEIKLYTSKHSSKLIIIERQKQLDKFISENNLWETYNVDNGYSIFGNDSREVKKLYFQPNLEPKILYSYKPETKVYTSPS